MKPFGWGEVANDSQPRYMIPTRPGSRSRCSCCGRRETFLGCANGVALVGGCEFRIRRWIKDPRSIYGAKP